MQCIGPPCTKSLLFLLPGEVHPGSIDKIAVGLRIFGVDHDWRAVGDKAKSRAAYDHFLELWKDGDAENHVLRQARYERGLQI